MVAVDFVVIRREDHDVSNRSVETKAMTGESDARESDGIWLILTVPPAIQSSRCSTGRGRGVSDIWESSHVLMEWMDSTEKIIAAAAHASVVWRLAMEFVPRLIVFVLVAVAVTVTVTVAIE